MKRVRQVSIVEREVAETVRVTESPKKLKPLKILISTVFCSQRKKKKKDLPNTDHDQDTADSDGTEMRHLPESFSRVEEASPPSWSAAVCKMQDDHTDDSD